MGYRIEDMSRSPEVIREVAAFLESFVRDGELDAPKEGDDQAEVWSRRMKWWWTDNPFCSEESPIGYRLYSPENELVGFSGFIPFDYSCDGERVPTLVTTTFFVREAHRSAVMGMMTRQRSLSREYQIVDGSPSEKMRVLLDRLGYRHPGDRYQYIFPLARIGGEISRALVRSVGLSFLPSPGGINGDHYVSNSPSEIVSIPSTNDRRMRKAITRESLSWLSDVGSEPRQFFGLCDSKGSLEAYAIGLYKMKWGIRACLLLDYADLNPDKLALSALLGRLVQQPFDCGVHPETDVVAWSVFESQRVSGATGLRRESILHYHLPRKWEDFERECVPFEGDLPLL